MSSDGDHSSFFAIAAAVVPNWFGVAVPAEGLVTSVGRIIFFHPTPGTGRLSLDGDYAKQDSGKWPELFLLHGASSKRYQLDWCPSATRS